MVSILNSDSSIDGSYSYYFFDATNNNITITLPEISFDGQKIKMTRFDTNNSNSITIQDSNSNTIFTMNIQSVLNLMSWQNVWYMI